MVTERHRIVGLLGTGGMGEVYRADDLMLGQSVALKFLPDSFADDADRRAMFYAEVRTAREIAHPNVCRVYDVGEVEGHTFLSMEYVDGDDLSSLLRRIGRVPHEKAVEIARQLCAGLAALHDRGILHRDLKPSNVMVDGRGRVRITDFGLAVPAGDEAGRARVGTPAYMAPEQLDGKGVDERSDVYSLGLVLYELFTGKRAFEADTVAELARLQRESTPTNPSTIITDLDPAVERVLGRCLEKDPKQRPPSAIAVAAALPGGDPLAEALAAGEIPSLEMVAAAGEKGGVRPGPGLGMVAAVILAIVLYAQVNARTKLYHYETPEKPPAVLVDAARGMLASFGYEDPPEDTAYGYRMDASVLVHTRRTDESADRWDSLETERPGALRFWYRESPQALVPMSSRGIARPDDPPPLESGMVNVVLDTHGRLFSMDVVPPRKDAANADSTASAETGAGAESAAADSAIPRAPDWDAVFAAAGMDRASFTESDPEWVPRTFADERRAWTGTFPGQDAELRVEAAARAGRPVFFRIVGPWTRNPDDDQGGTVADSVFVMSFLIFFLAILIGGIFLGVRNVRLGRGDKVGARRLAMLLFLVQGVIWLLFSHRTGDLNQEINKFFDGAGGGLVASALIWIFYLALEPYARRTWPDQMIAWSRMITGRIRDPLVGRDILVGGVFFLLHAVLVAAGVLGRAAAGLPPGQPDAIQWATFLGLHGSVGWILGAFVNSLFYALFLLLVLMLLRLLAGAVYGGFRWTVERVVPPIARRLPEKTGRLDQRLAVVAFAVLVAAFTGFSGGDEKLLAAAQGVLIGVLWSWVLFRFGLVTFFVGMFFWTLATSFPVTLDASAWWSGASFLPIAVILATTAFGLHCALGARPLIGDELRGE
jgi:serine/threonine-protein kinase